MSTGIGRFTRMLMTALVVGLFTQAFYYYPRLPERVASHFNFSGAPDDWMSRKGMILFSTITFAAVLGIFTFLGNLLPKAHGFINIPYREYWLAPERRAETIAYVQQWLRGYTCLTLLLLLIIFELVYRANLVAAPRLSIAFAWMIGFYLAAATVFVVRLLLHFRKPHAAE